MSSLEVAEPHTRTVRRIADDLGVDPERGLDAAEARRRLEADGPNELRSTPPVPAWRRFLAQFKDALIYLLLAAVVISVLAWVIEGARGVPVDAVVITTILLANAVLGFVQENRAADAVAALRGMTEVTATVLRDGQQHQIASRDLVRGDVLVLGEGDAVGADARLFEATALRVAEASLTGESEAVMKSPEDLSGRVALGDRKNMVFKGTAVTQGVGRAIVTGTGMHSQMGQIAAMLDSTESEPTPLTREVNGLGRTLGAAVIAIAFVVMVTIYLTSDIRTASDAVVVLLLGVSLAVAAVPEGLPAILSVVLAVGVQRMAGHKAIVKDLSSVETLGSASVICSDKTGTLTKSEMTVQRICTPSGAVSLSGIGYSPENGRATGPDGEEVSGDLLTEAQLVLAYGSLANDAQLDHLDGQWQIQGDPTEAAFLVAAQKLIGSTEIVDTYTRLGQVPFTSERKKMSVLDRSAKGTRVLSKGAPDVLLSNCTHYRVGDRVEELDEAMRASILGTVEDLSSQAYRTLGVAYRMAEEADRALDDSIEHDLIWVGMVGIIDPPRPEAQAAIADARRAGIRVMMITGDHPVTAAKIATDLGIVRQGARARTGVELDAMDDHELTETVRRTSVYARVAPQNKLQIVDALQADGNVVAMTGDGVNDAPALKTADIGVAMGVTGAEVTKEAGNMILADDNFATIVTAVRQGRMIFDNIRKFLRYLLSSNMGEVMAVFFGVVLAGVLGLTQHAEGAVVVPLLATQILWINLVTDSGPALAMGIDPPVDDVMNRKPRKITDRVVSGRMWIHVLFLGLVMAVLMLVTMDLFLEGGLITYGREDLTTARTAAFTVMVLLQLFNAFNARSPIHSAFSHMFSNKWLWAAVLLGAALQVAAVHVPFLQTAFGTTDLSGQQWLICIGMASIVLWVEELRKAVYRLIGPAT
ncbi:cation-translocating P-type ATPase [Enemella sp. A6]|uniref:cation-translocating P-type ATPase n=1 Tax=Enemella sp. A6 TaxID=3440152 RepID=UPI003EBA2EA0